MLTLDKKVLPPLLPGFKPETFQTITSPALYCGPIPAPSLYVSR